MSGRSHRGPAILRSVLALLLLLGGITAVAHYHGTTRTPALRLAMMVSALSMGVAGGVVAERLRPRGRRRRPAHSRRPRQLYRQAAFILTGVVIAGGILALFAVPQTWVVVAASTASIALIWAWYGAEAIGLSRAPRPRRPRRR